MSILNYFKINSVHYEEYDNIEDEEIVETEDLYAYFKKLLVLNYF